MISFPALPEDSDGSLDDIFAGSTVNGVIGEGVVAYQFNNNWVGSLTQSGVTPQGGYWAKADGATTVTVESANPNSYDADGAVVYNLHEGNNLVSYPFTSANDVDDALAGNADNIWGIAGEGFAAINTGSGFAGSLNDFEGGNGYWLVAYSDIEGFTYANPTNDSGANLSKGSIAKVKEVPEAYKVAQSQKQSFYFVEDATIDGVVLEAEDLVVAFNGEEILGARYWNGSHTDVAAMIPEGVSIEDLNITFKVLDATTGEYVDMVVETHDSMESADLSMYVVTMSTDLKPTKVSLYNAYPNPFNPSTKITYDVPSEMDISLMVFDIRGRMVQELVSGVKAQGQYELNWDANAQASGVYIVRLIAGESIHTQKIMLIK